MLPFRIRLFFHKITTRYHLRRIIRQLRLDDKADRTLPDLSGYTDQQLIAGLLQYAYCQRMNDKDIQQGYRQYRRLIELGEMRDPEEVAHELCEYL